VRVRSSSPVPVIGRCHPQQQAIGQHRSSTPVRSISPMRVIQSPILRAVAMPVTPVVSTRASNPSPSPYSGAVQTPYIAAALATSACTQAATPVVGYRTISTTAPCVAQALQATLERVRALEPPRSTLSSISSVQDPFRQGCQSCMSVTALDDGSQTLPQVSPVLGDEWRALQHGGGSSSSLDESAAPAAMAQQRPWAEASSWQRPLAEAARQFQRQQAEGSTSMHQRTGAARLPQALRLGQSEPQPMQLLRQLAVHTEDSPSGSRRSLTPPESPQPLQRYAGAARGEGGVPAVGGHRAGRSGSARGSLRSPGRSTPPRRPSPSPSASRGGGSLASSVTTNGAVDVSPRPVAAGRRLEPAKQLSDPAFPRRRAGISPRRSVPSPRRMRA